jgi:hypothetical protein
MSRIQKSDSGSENKLRRMMGPRLRFERIHRILAVLVSLSLLSAMTAPALVWACEGGGSNEYEGEEAANAIAAGTSTNTSVGFEFDNAGEKQSATCEETYTWAKQAKGKTFIATPSYNNCKYKGANVPAFVVGAACRYQFNQPVALGGGKWETTQSITGAGCEIKMKFEANVCEVKVKNEVANEGINKVSLENVVKNLRLIPVVSPVKYTSAGCANPIAAAGAILRYASQQEVAKARIG